MVLDRAAGVLLHPTSLPGPYGVGDLGPAAFDYIDWLAEAKATWWQVLPLNPPGDGHSPYCARSTFAGNCLLLSPDSLVTDGLLDENEIRPRPDFPADFVDYPPVYAYKQELWARAFARFRATPPAGMVEAFAKFKEAEKAWLDDFVVFTALKSSFNQAPWYDWPPPLGLHEAAAVAAWRAEHGDEVEFRAFTQFLFARQWERLHTHAAHRGVRILGDLPMFVALDSAEVWAHRELFLLDAQGRATKLSGVPPDYFSKTGQLWGNPLYDWGRMAEDGFQWWVERVRHTLQVVDAVRLDHFRGFVAHWEVPPDEATTVNGRWVPGPGRKLFDALAAALGALPFIAEDLGDIDQPVRDLRDELDLPGMAVLQFAFQPSPRSIFLPYHHHQRMVVYTGTHDNNTALGWYTDDANDEVRSFVRRYLATDGNAIHWDMVRAALASVADLAIVPHQDLAGVGSSGRMNMPGAPDGNWRFRLTPAMLAPAIRDRFAELIWLYGRQPEQRDNR